VALSVFTGVTVFIVGLYNRDSIDNGHPILLYHPSYYYTFMNTFRTRFLITLTLLAFIIAPASALYKLQDVQVLPAAESFPSGTWINITTMIALIPPGPTTTFVIWDNLVLSTELSEPRWNVVVLVNEPSNNRSHQVVVTPAEGPVVTIPGYLLSYPTDKNVSIRVQLDGQVPPSPDQRPFTVLKVEELNDRGEMVGGPAEIVTRIIAPSATPLQPLPTTQGTIQPPATPTEAGVSLIPVIAALVATMAILRRMKN
jgi:hypothetical protein